MIIKNNPQVQIFIKNDINYFPSLKLNGRDSYYANNRCDIIIGTTKNSIIMDDFPIPKGPKCIFVVEAYQQN